MHLPPFGELQPPDRRSARAGQVMAYWIGTRISGTPNWAGTAPSSYSRRECTRLSPMDDDIDLTGRGDRTNNHRAWMSSRPLFIMVAESMVILAPIFQFGWRRASSGVMRWSSAAVFPKNGPPDAVRSTGGHPPLPMASGGGSTDRRRCLVGTEKWRNARCPQAAGGRLCAEPPPCSPTRHQGFPYLPRPRRAGLDAEGSEAALHPHHRVEHQIRILERREARNPSIGPDSTTNPCPDAEDAAAACVKNAKRRTEAAELLFEHPVILNAARACTGYRARPPPQRLVPMDPVSRHGQAFGFRGGIGRFVIGYPSLWSRWLTAGTAFTYMPGYKG